MPPKKKVRSLEELVQTENKLYSSVTHNPSPLDDTSTGLEDQLLSSIACDARKTKIINAGIKESGKGTKGVMNSSTKGRQCNIPKHSGLVATDVKGTKWVMSSSTKGRECNIPKNSGLVAADVQGIVSDAHLDHTKQTLESLTQCGSVSKKLIHGSSSAQANKDNKESYTNAMDIDKARGEVGAAQMIEPVSDGSKMSQQSRLKTNDPLDSCSQNGLVSKEKGKGTKGVMNGSTNIIDIGKTSGEAGAAQMKKPVSNGSKMSQRSGAKIVDNVDSRNQSGFVSKESGKGTKGVMNSSTKAMECNIPKNSDLVATSVHGIMDDARLAHTKHMLDLLTQCGTVSKKSTQSSSSAQANKINRDSYTNATYIGKSSGEAGVAQMKKPAINGSDMFQQSGVKIVDIVDSCNQSGLMSKESGKGTKGVMNSSTKTREFNIPNNSDLVATSVHGNMGDARLAHTKHMLEFLTQCATVSEKSTRSSSSAQANKINRDSYTNATHIGKASGEAESGKGTKGVMNSSTKTRECNIPNNSDRVAKSVHGIIGDARLAHTNRMLESLTQCGSLSKHSIPTEREYGMPRSSQGSMGEALKSKSTDILLGSPNQVGSGSTRPILSSPRSLEFGIPKNSTLNSLNCHGSMGQDPKAQSRNTLVGSSNQDGLGSKRPIHLSSSSLGSRSKRCILTSSTPQESDMPMDSMHHHGVMRETLKANSKAKMSYSCTTTSTGTKRLSPTSPNTMESNTSRNSIPMLMKNQTSMNDASIGQSTRLFVDDTNEWEDNITTISMPNSMDHFGSHIPTIPNPRELEEQSMQMPCDLEEPATLSHNEVEETTVPSPHEVESRSTGFRNHEVAREISNEENEGCLGNNARNENNENAGDIPTVTSSRRMRRSNLRVDESQTEEPEFARRKGRGWTGYRTMKPPLGKSKHECVTLKNEPVERQCVILTNFLGVKARDTDAFPLHLHWGKFQDRSFDDVWEEVLHLFNFTSFETKTKPIMFRVRQWCQSKVKHAVINHRFYLKRYLKKRSPEQLLVSPESRVSQDQWEKLLEYWCREEIQLEAIRNANNRSKIRPTYGLGRKSMRQKEFEMRLNGLDPSIVDTYVVSHKKKNGEYADEYTRRSMEAVEEEAERRQVRDSKDPLDFLLVTDHVYGGHHGGYERGFGNGITRQMLKQASSMQKAHETYEEIEKEAEFYAEALASAKLKLAQLMNQDVGCSRRHESNNEEEDDNDDDQNCMPCFS